MARLAEASEFVHGVEPAEILDLWRDTDRWHSFVDGLHAVDSRSSDWPAVGATVVWESAPGGRGRVSEQVTGSEPAAFATSVRDPSLTGRQRLTLQPDAGGTRLTLVLEYELANASAFQSLMDQLFIRRALRDSLRRTLERFAAELESTAPAG
jgi:uncharacterized membrane protein